MWPCSGPRLCLSPYIVEIFDGFHLQCDLRRVVFGICHEVSDPIVVNSSLTEGTHCVGLSSLFWPYSHSIPESNGTNGACFWFASSVSDSFPLKSLNHSAAKKPSSRPSARRAPCELLRISWLLYSMLSMNCVYMCVKSVQGTLLMFFHGTFSFITSVLETDSGSGQFSKLTPPPPI